ncbi:MAG: glycosyltransferase family 39 protein [Bryobacterales bacterium]|nr:glycosyltransferase family 39 protein [Bryobacterales bacterium]
MAKSAKRTKAGTKKRAGRGLWLRLAEAGTLTLILGVTAWLAIRWHAAAGYTLYYGDAASHLAIARRILDSRTPGVFQIGSVWLPLPHLLMLPWISDDHLWRSGLAGAIPAAACFVLGGVFLYLAIHRWYECRVAAGTAVLVYALNPNLLYLQAIPMTEPVLMAAIFGLLYAMVSYAKSGSVWAVLGGALALNAASLTRYEGWFLTPFAALFFWLGGKPRRFWHGLMFGTLASAGPVWWLFHNWWFYGDIWYFFDGPYSAKAIYQRQLEAGMSRYPGDHDLERALVQLRAAAELCAGSPLFWLGIAGSAVAVLWRAWLPMGLFLLPVIFYILSIYSSGTPIFVPHLWPNSYYNIRYGFAAYPLLVLGAGSLVLPAPLRFRIAVAPAVVLIAISQWIAYPRPESWMVWKESQVNSEARRAWTTQAAGYLREHYRPGSGVFGTLGDIASVYREAGIPLKEVLHEGNHPHWNAAVARPDLFLWEEWAVAISGDSVATAILRAQRRGPRYVCVKMISVKGAPVIEIYHRESREK